MWLSSRQPLWFSLYLMFCNFTEIVLHEYLEHYGWQSMGSSWCICCYCSTNLFTCGGHLGCPHHSPFSIPLEVLMWVYQFFPPGHCACPHTSLVRTWSSTRSMPVKFLHTIYASQSYQQLTLYYSYLGISHLISIIIFTSRVCAGFNIWIYYDVFGCLVPWCLYHYNFMRYIRWIYLIYCTYRLG